MYKLFKMKEWLNVADAANHISKTVGEEVSPAQIFRLALDRQLKLSVIFVNHARVRRGRLANYTDAELRSNIENGIYSEDLEWRKIPRIPPFDANNLTVEAVLDGDMMVLMSQKIGEDTYLTLEKEITVLRKGVWDLPMLGSEQLDVENIYQALTGGPTVTLETLGGPLIEGPNGDILEIQERASLNDEDGFFPACGLPEGTSFVLRTQAISDCEKLINGERKAEKMITANERNSLLTIIAALSNQCNIKHQERGAARLIADLTEKLGAPITDDTVRKYLAKIPEALERRSK